MLELTTAAIFFSGLALLTVARGLRARLQMQSLLTGQLYVDLDLRPEQTGTLRGARPGTVEIPTTKTAIQTLMSQVDYAPTLLGLLNWSYASRFFGWDIRRVADGQRALLGNYQRLGLYESGGLNVMMPVRRFAEFDLDLRTGLRSCRTTVVVVGCQRWSPSLWRVSVLFTGEPADCENLSLAA